KGFHLTTYKEALDLFKSPEDYLKWPEEVKYSFESAIFLAHYKEKLSSTIYLSPYFDPSLSKDGPSLSYTKIKIGRQDVALDKKLLKNIDSKKIRLDSNRSLDFESFKELTSDLKDYDYFEDPFKNPKLMINFPNERFALDESVLDDELWKLKQVTTFVLKPSALGLGNTIELIKIAKQLGKRVVISSTFESEAGHLTLAALGAYSDMALGYREHHGLGTISLLEAPLSQCQLMIKDNSAELKFKS
ncbi:MAG: hypothetical protein ACJARO_002104, partial [Bacteriovoracaceae bacterium]